MVKLFHFDSLREHYLADACVISCIDARFDLATRKFLKRLGIAIYDQVKIPGAAKALATPERDADRDFVMGMVRTSMRLHGSTRVLLIGHNDCGGYPGGSADTIVAGLWRAAAVVVAAEPTLTVECYFADFDGIYQCGPAAS
jgi:hypothetical protein